MELGLKQWFAQNGFDENRLEQPNNQGCYALILASQQGRYDILRQLLINESIDFECVDSYGNNALWAACYAESEACLRTLLKQGCDIDYQNPVGNTALMYASSSGKDAVVDFLLKAGADTTLRNQDDLTALDLAASPGCLRLLRNA